MGLKMTRASRSSTCWSVGQQLLRNWRKDKAVVTLDKNLVGAQLPQPGCKCQYRCCHEHEINKTRRGFCVGLLRQAHSPAMSSASHSSAEEVIAAVKAHPVASSGILVDVERFQGSETEIELVFDKTQGTPDEVQHCVQTLMDLQLVQLLFLFPHPALALPFPPHPLSLDKQASN